jgi:uncharacterized protein involved in tolerance to divalent cations
VNILIRIKSLFSGEGFTAAQSEIAATKASAANVKLPQELEKGAAKAEKEVDKLNKQLRGTNSALNATQALARGDVFGALNQAAGSLSEKLGNIGKQLGAAFAGFGIGWQVGTMIRDLTGLGNALDKLIVPPAAAGKSIRDMANERLAGLRAELDATKARMEGLTKAADDAAKRVEQAINAKIAKREQVGVQVEQAAPEEDRPVVAAKTSLDVSRQELEIARAKTAEEKRAADETAKAIAAEQERLVWAEKQLAEAEAIFKVYKDLGRSEEVAVDVKTASERVDALKKQIEDLRKVAGEQAIQLTVTQTAETKAETAVMRAEGGLKQAETRRTEQQQDKRTKQQEDIANQRDAIAKATKAVEEMSAAASEAPVEVKVKVTADLEAAQKALGALKTQLASMEAAALPPPLPKPQTSAEPAPAQPAAIPPEADTKPDRKSLGTINDLQQESAQAIAKAKETDKRKLERNQRDAREEADRRKKEAEEDRTQSTKDLEQAKQFRSYALSPRLRVEADKAERDATQKKEREERTYQSLLKRAQAAGYKVSENAAGDFDVTRDGRIAGTRSKRLADVVRAEAERLKGEREKKQAEVLEKDAMKAQIDAAQLLAKIAKNTEQGPVV